jgi:hypothetical protein
VSNPSLSAESEYKTMKDNLEAEALKARLRGAPTPSAPSNGAVADGPKPEIRIAPSPALDLEPALPIDKPSNSVLNSNDDDDDDDAPDALSAVRLQGSPLAPGLLITRLT